VKAIFGYRLFWLATALSLWQLGCGTNSNSTLDAAKAQRTLTLWAAGAAQGFSFSSATITEPLTPFQGDPNHIVVRCRVVQQGYGYEYTDSRADFVRGPDKNWYLSTVLVAGPHSNGLLAAYRDINLKVQ